MGRMHTRMATNLTAKARTEDEERQTELDIRMEAVRLSSYTQAYSVIYNYGSVPRSAIFSPRETSHSII